MELFSEIIGQERKVAVEKLSQAGYNEIEVVINSKETSKTDSLLVVKAEVCGSKVRLICGEFYLKIKG